MEAGDLADPEFEVCKASGAGPTKMKKKDMFSHINDWISANLNGSKLTNRNPLR
jgi:hypothetical protein